VRGVPDITDGTINTAWLSLLFTPVLKVLHSVHTAIVAWFVFSPLHSFGPRP